MTDLIPNIDKTYDGVEYAYEQEGIHNTEYLANCIEHGEEFFTTFYAPSTYTKEQLMSIGRDNAMAYGGECINIEKVISKKGNQITGTLPIV